MPEYGLLKRAHEEYDADLFAELEDLYEGGYQIQKHAKAYLKRLANETPTAYEERIQSAAYLPYLGQVVDQLTAGLFEAGLTVIPAADAENPDTPGEYPDRVFYGSFAKNANGAGKDFAGCIRDMTRDALLKRRALLGVDFPKVSDDERAEIATRKDEDEAGAANAYLLEIPVEQLINWDRNDDGSFKWVVLNRVTQPQAGPLDPSDTIVEEFKVWTVNDAGKVQWDLYRTTYKPKKPPKKNDDVQRVDSGVTEFGEIPIVELLLPKGLWIGNKIGTLVREHWQRRTTLNGGEQKSLYEIPVVQLGSEIGAPRAALPSMAQQNPHRGEDPVAQFTARGALVLGTGDKFGFEGPSGVAYKIVDEQLKDLKDEIFRVVHLMAASVSNNKSAALGRSGLSKQQDKLDTAIVLSALGEIIRAISSRVYRMISEARNEDVVWTPKGLDSFEVDDREETMNEALQCDAVPINSPTFKASWKTRLALKLEKGLPPETQTTIREEIQGSVEAETELHALAQEAARVGMNAEPDGDEGGPGERDGDDGANGNAKAKPGTSTKPATNGRPPQRGKGAR